MPDEAVAIAQESVGAATEVAHQAGETAGPEAQGFVTDAVNSAFVDGWHAGSWVSCAVVVLGAVVAWRFLPARAEEEVLTPTCARSARNNCRPKKLLTS